jgi:hypothetical protein
MAVAFLPQSINYTTPLTDACLNRAKGCAIISAGHKAVNFMPLGLVKNMACWAKRIAEMAKGRCVGLIAGLPVGGIAWDLGAIAPILSVSFAMRLLVGGYWAGGLTELSS